MSISDSDFFFLFLSPPPLSNLASELCKKLSVNYSHSPSEGELYLPLPQGHLILFLRASGITYVSTFRDYVFLIKLDAFRLLSLKFIHLSVPGQGVSETFILEDFLLCSISLLWF
ncbi:hypothetical protein KIL84_011303 [Mauremys mutica]|uniref:Uncharacterized protein n=1 Tax=Mauremys mutica TaxID=74926 RepID=A0A9D4B275_9SAUR|nr:hypothetical protein KIL84_011303 [Mauremys mutica]